MEDCWTKRMCGLLAHTTQFSFLRCVRGVAIHVCTANDVAQCASLLLKREIMLEFTSGLNARCASQAERITRAHLCGTRAQYMHLRRERAHMFIVWIKAHISCHTHTYCAHYMGGWAAAYRFLVLGVQMCIHYRRDTLAYCVWATKKHHVPSITQRTSLRNNNNNIYTIKVYIIILWCLVCVLVHNREYPRAALCCINAYSTTLVWLHQTAKLRIAIHTLFFAVSATQSGNLQNIHVG